MTLQKQTIHEAPSFTKPVTEDAILKVAKEVVIKFIEVGRLSPANFHETFSEIYTSIHKTVKATYQ